MYVPDLVKDSFGVHYTCADHAIWFLQNNDFKRIAETAVSYIRNPSSQNISTIKEGKNRFVFLIKNDTGAGAPGTVIIKSFPMTRFKQRLYRYRRYGAQETVNLLRAARAGIPVPKVYGFGLIKPFGLVDTTMVMMEYLEGNQSINGLLCKSEVSETVKIKLLNRVGRLLTKLYEGCCNHIDLNSRSIWIGEKEIDDKIIDFQYVTFLPHPSISVLIFHMAYFSTSVRSLVSEEILDNWVREQLAALSAKNIDQWMALYRQFRFKRLSRKQRLNIK